MNKINWANKKVLVTGGASFIGSHLTEDLVKKGATLRVADNLTSGTLENLSEIRNAYEFVEGDLRDRSFALEATKGCDIVFHLAADHGGRGYISSHPANCVDNMALDNTVMFAAAKNGVERITYASSACVYPTDVQENKVLLQEEMVSFIKRGGAFADEEYGWAKLMGELSIKAYHKQRGTKTSAVRIYTAYGPRANETHAIMALIAKAFIKQSPFEIWGDGTQTRNFTYVQDIVEGLILACENIEDGTAVNAGISNFISLNEAAETVFEVMDWTPPDGIKYLTNKPVGVLHRAADGTFAKRTTGWKPRYSFRDGMKETIEWYVSQNDPAMVKNQLEGLLWQRKNEKSSAE